MCHAHLTSLINSTRWRANFDTSHNILFSICVILYLFYEGDLKRKGDLLFSLFYKRNTIIFYVIPYLLHIVVTLVHKLPDAICEECFQLHVKQCMHCVLDLFIVCKWRPCIALSCQQFGNQMGQDLDCVPGGEELEFQFLNSSFNSCCCHMRLSVVMIQNKSICQNSSAFTMNNGF